MKYARKDWEKELKERFGAYCEDYRFVCPRCGNVASGQEFRDAGASPSAMYQECIGRYVKGKGCDWCAYGLFRTLGKGDVVVADDGTEVDTFAMDAKAES